MKRIFYIICIITCCFSVVARSQAVFTENFNRAAFGSTGGIPSTTYSLSAGTTVDMIGADIAYLSSDATANVKYVSAPLASFASPFNTTLSNNTSLITWVFNIRISSRATSNISNTQMSGGINLCSSGGSNFFNGTASGYAIIFNAGSTGGLKLIRFNRGITTEVTNVIVPISTLSFTNMYSVRVTYNPQTSQWSLYLRDDGTTAFANPNIGINNLYGTAVDTTYTRTPMSTFGYIFGFNAGTGKNIRFDNFKVQLGPSFVYDPLTLLSCTNTTRSFAASITNTNTSGANMPRIYYRKNRGAWVNRTGTYASGTTFIFSMPDASLGGLAIGDTVFYHLVARDTNTYGNILSSCAPGFSASNLTTIITHPTNPHYYIVGAPPSALRPIISDSILCQGTTLELGANATPLTSYRWLGPDGFRSTLQSPSLLATVAASGIYTLTSTNSCGTTLVTTPTISVIPRPIISITPDSQSICPLASTTFVASGASSYSWAPSVALSTTLGDRVVATALAPISVFTVTGSNGVCSSTRTAVLQYNTLPYHLAVAATPSLICYGSATSLDVRTYNSFYNRVESIPYARITQTAPVSIRTTDWTGNNDEGTVGLRLPFSFNFYGKSYDSVFISTNGFISFKNVPPTFLVTPLPSTTVPKPMIALFYSDLECPDNSVIYSIEGIAPRRKFVISYQGVTPFIGSGFLSGQIVLNEGNSIIEMSVSNSNIAIHTCGVQNDLGNAALTATDRNATYYEVAIPEAWRFYGQPNRLSYSWTPAATLTAPTAAHTAATGLTSTTIFSLAVTDSTLGCIHRNVVNVNVGTLTSFISGPRTICSGSVATLTFTGPAYDTIEYTINDGTVQEVVLDSSGNASIISAPLYSTTIYKIKAVKSAPCYQLITDQVVTISVETPPSSIAGALSVCQGSSTPFTNTTSGGTWLSSNTAIGTVSATGVVTGVATGNVIISYTIGSCSPVTKSIAVLVPPTTILPSTTVSICSGSGSTLSNAVLGGTWSCSNTAIAAVTPSGYVTGVAAGNAVITYTTGCGTAVTKNITIKPLPAAITGASFAAPILAVCINRSANYTNTLAGGSWTNFPTTSGVINASTGLFSASTTPGATLITYSVNGCTSTLNITVGSTPPSANAGPSSVCAQGTVTLTNAIAGGIWTSANARIATVHPSTGVVSGIDSGIVSVSYSTGCGAASSTAMTVKGSTPILTTNSICAGNVLSLTSAVTSAGSFSWVGPNGFSSTLQNPTISNASFLASGSYKLNFRSASSACTSTANIFSRVSPTPAFTLTATPTVICPEGSSILSTSVGSISDYNVYPIPFDTLSLSTVGSGPIGDRATTTTALPFNFKFYGVDYNTINIAVDGYVNFGPVAYVASPRSFPTTSAPLATIALFWCDLIATAGQITYDTLGVAPNRRFVINYNRVRGASDSAIYTGQIVLYETLNMVEVYVASANTNRSSVLLCGIQNRLGTAGITAPGQNATNYTVESAGQAWRFAQPSYSYNWRPTAWVSDIANARTTALPSSTQHTYSLTVSDARSYCLGKTDSITVRVSPLPRIFNVTGGGVICGIERTGISVGISGSEVGVSYQLQQMGRNIGAPMEGTGAPFSFGLFSDTTAPYKVVAIRSGMPCSQNMADSAIIRQYQPPTAYTVTGGTNCSSSGVIIGLTSSQISVRYQLHRNDTAIGATILGTGSSLSWGSFTQPGVYSIIAIGSGGCTTPMLQADTVQPNPLVFNLSSAHACEGTPLNIRLNGSQPLFTYQLQKNGVVVQTLVGTGAALDLAPITENGVYTMKAIGTNSCSTNMNGADTIFMRPTLTLGASPVICMPLATARLSFSDTTGAPRHYSIVWDTLARRAGFMNVSNVPLDTFITVALPSTANTTYSGTLTVANSVCSSNPYDITLQARPQLTLNMDTVITPCIGYSAILALRSTAGNTVAYTINGGAVLTQSFSSSICTLTTAPLADTTIIKILSLSNGFCNYTLDTTITIVPKPFVWQGTVSSNWHNPLNWSCNQLPTAMDAILIPGGTPYAPIITDTVIAVAKHLIVALGASVQLNSRTQLHIKGNFTHHGRIVGEGKLILNGTASQHWVGKGSVANITLSNTNDVYIDSGSAPKVNSVLTLTTGRLFTNDSLILGADSNETARLSPLPINAQIRGKVTVQYYMPGGRRGFRLISHPFNSSISLEQLQRNMDITGVGGAANGFTTTGSNAPSAFRYNPLVGNSMNATDPGWRPITSIRTTADSNQLQAYKSIRLFCRGAKGEGLGFGSYVPSSNTLSLYGTPNQQQQIVRLQKGTGANQDYNMIGNPYASPTDIGTVIFNAKQSGNVTGAAFYVWNPYLAVSGQFQAIPIGTSAPIPYVLQSGGGFQVRAAHANDSLIFQESNKSIRPSSSLLKSISNSITLLVYDQENHLWDNWMLQLDSNATSAQDAQKDALKIHGGDFNLYSLASYKERLAIDSRPLFAGGSIPIGIHSNYMQTFVFKFGQLNLPNNTAVYLKDNWLKQSVLVESGVQYTFDVTKDDNTQGDHRFELSLQMLAELDTLAPNWKIAPNPASGELQIHFDNIPQGPIAIEVLTLNGAQMYSHDYEALTSERLSISAKLWPAGVYLIKVGINGRSFTQKFVKE